MRLAPIHHETANETMVASVSAINSGAQWPESSPYQVPTNAKTAPAFAEGANTMRLWAANDSSVGRSSLWQLLHFTVLRDVVSAYLQGRVCRQTGQIMAITSRAV